MVKKRLTYGNKRLSFSGKKIVTYVTSAPSITPWYYTMLSDGYTSAWYDASLLSTLTFSQDSSVSRWNDVLGSGRDVSQNTGANQPLYKSNPPSLYFDGTNDYLSSLAYESLPQPNIVYMVVKTFSTGYKFLFSGKQGAAYMIIDQDSPYTRLYAGAGATPRLLMTNNKWYILNVVNKGADSSFKLFTDSCINTAGTYNLGSVGYNISAAFNAANPVNMQLKELIIRKSEASDASIYSYLRDKHFTNFSYPSVLVDGSTVGWYVSDASDMTMNVDAALAVSRWNDILGSGRDLIQGTGTNQPLWQSDGVLFDGVDNVMKTAAFTVNQPFRFYMVMKHVTYTNTDYIFDGNTNNKVALMQANSSPRLQLNAGIGVVVINNTLPVGNYGVIRIKYEGANTTLQVNELPTSTVDAGTNALDGFTLGSWYSKDYYWSNIQVKEIIIRSSSDDGGEETLIYNYLKNKYGL